MASTPTTHQTTKPTHQATAPRRGTSTGDLDHLTAALTDAQAGNQHAFRTLYHDLHPRLLGQLRFLVGHTDAADVASETWLHLVVGINNFRGTYGNFRSWAAAIAQRRAVDHLRRTPAADPTNPATLPDKPAPNNTEHDALEALATAATLNLVKVLPPEQRKIVLLRIIAGFDAPATARILGKHPGAIRTSTHRALRTLATELPERVAAAPSRNRSHNSP